MKQIFTSYSLVLLSLFFFPPFCCFRFVFFKMLSTKKLNQEYHFDKTPVDKKGIERKKIMHLFTVLNYYKHADIDKKKMYKTCLGQETRFSYVQIQYKTVHTQILIFLIKKKKKANQKTMNQILHLFGPKPIHKSHSSGTYYLPVGKY